MSDSRADREWLGLYQLNQQIVRQATDPYQITLRIEQYLRANYIYSLTPPPTRYRSPYAAFLFDTKTGYCQHFAGAMAVLLRFNGIPARVAVGFTTGRAGRHRTRSSSAGPTPTPGSRSTFPASAGCPSTPRPATTCPAPARRRRTPASSTPSPRTRTRAVRAAAGTAPPKTAGPPGRRGAAREAAEPRGPPPRPPRAPVLVAVGARARGRLARLAARPGRCAAPGAAPGRAASGACEPALALVYADLRDYGVGVPRVPDPRGDGGGSSRSASTSTRPR